MVGSDQIIISSCGGGKDKTRTSAVDNEWIVRLGESQESREGMSTKIFLTGV